MKRLDYVGLVKSLLKFPYQDIDIAPYFTRGDEQKLSEFV